MLYPNTIRYDARHDKMYIFSTQWIPKGTVLDRVLKNFGFGSWSRFCRQELELVSWIETVNYKTGSCNAMKTQIPDGIISDWAYDPITQTGYAALTTSGGSNLYSVDVTTGQTIGNVVVDGSNMPESMEFVYV